MPIATQISARRLIRLLACTVLAAPLASPGQDIAAPNVRLDVPPIFGFAHIAIRVADIGASKAFYEKLGYQQAFDANKDGVVTQSFIKVNDRQFIELYPKTAADPAIGFLHLCFDGEDLAALYSYDVAQGLTPTQVRTAGAGNLLFTLRGPENQNIEYTQYMPGSKHSGDHGQHLGANRVADNFFAVALGMKDVQAASAFYTQKLGFKAIGGERRGSVLFLNPYLFLITGSRSATDASGGPGSQQIVIEPLTGPASKIFLYVPDLGKTSADLKQRGVAFKPGANAVTVTDPDGNALVFTSSKTAS
jgi:catechol 2,3-dioxygenase-like lactoylglutathione lyase family enzyme